MWYISDGTPVRGAPAAKERNMRIAFLGDGSLNHVRRWAGYFHERGHETLLLSFESVDGCLVPARRLKSRFPTKLLGYLSALGSIRNELAVLPPGPRERLVSRRLRLRRRAKRVSPSRRFEPRLRSSRRLSLVAHSPAPDPIRAEAGGPRPHRRRRALAHRDLAGTSPGKILKTYLGIDESIFFPRKSAPEERGRAAAPAS